MLSLLGIIRAVETDLTTTWKRGYLELVATDKVQVLQQTEHFLKPPPVLTG